MRAALAPAITKIRSARRGARKASSATRNQERATPNGRRGANFLWNRNNTGGRGAMRGKRRRRAGGSLGRTRSSPPTQRELVRDVMVASSKYGLWLTLRQLARLTGYGEASISAQLRHLRKPEYGGFVVEKRWCYEGRVGRGATWEYRLRAARRKETKRTKGT